VVERSEVIRGEIGQTRSEMGETLDALAYKANVPARTKGWLGRKKDAAMGAGGSMVSAVSGATDSMISRVSGATPSGGDMQAGAGRVKDTAERNPVGLALAGAAVGFVAGILAPTTQIENEKLGPMADQVKETAAQAGQEALERGKEVAQSAAQSAVETAKEEGRSHADDLSSSVQERAKDALSDDPSRRST
jgi:gas vesicle protein